MIIKAKVLLHDPDDVSSGEWYTLEQAHREGFVDFFKDNFFLADKNCMKLSRALGIKDSNGVEIWEGDLLDFDQREWGNIFTPEVVTFESFFPEFNMCGTLGDIAEWRQVVGSIYPEKK